MCLRSQASAAAAEQQVTDMGYVREDGGDLCSRVVIGAVVLAAGAGSRLGHRPQCLLELGGVPLIRRTLDALLDSGADQSLLGAEDITALIRAWKQRAKGVRVLQPHVGGERANPVIFDATVRDEILAGRTGDGCRQWQAAHVESVQAWATDNQGYRVDIDTLEDIAAFERDTGHVLRWPAALAGAS
jgi:CTP:molybdopterin cytidylyltransferase MocA